MGLLLMLLQLQGAPRGWFEPFRRNPIVYVAIAAVFLLEFSRRIGPSNESVVGPLPLGWLYDVFMAGLGFCITYLIGVPLIDRWLRRREQERWTEARELHLRYHCQLLYSCGRRMASSATGLAWGWNLYVRTVEGRTAAGHTLASNLRGWAADIRQNGSACFADRLSGAQKISNLHVEVERSAEELVRLEFLVFQQMSGDAAAPKRAVLLSALAIMLVDLGDKAIAMKSQEGSTGVLATGLADVLEAIALYIEGTNLRGANSSAP